MMSRTRRRVLLAAALVLMMPVFFPVQWIWRITRSWVHKDLVDRYAAEGGLDPILVMAVMRVESGFSRQAVSQRGAVGLMQLMPETARDLSRRLGMDPTRLRLDDPAVNIRLGAHYLAALTRDFNGDAVAVLAAYNAGPSNVRHWKQKWPGPLSVESIPFPETRIFVGKVQETESWLKRLQRLKRIFHV